MIKFLIRRIFFLIFTLLFVSMAIFAISEIAPGDLAVNSLGNTITPQQKASFNAQNGLDQPITTRYIRWLVGSEWQAAQRIGTPLTRIYDETTNQTGWWGVLPDGTLYRNYTDDGITMIRIERQPDGTRKEVTLGDDAGAKKTA